MKLAAIDIGSNSIHLVIARVSEQGMLEILDQEKDMVRLGAETLRNGALDAQAMERGLQALTHFKTLADRRGVDALLAAATSAIREARNGGAYLERIKQETGIDVHVISGREEARLIYLGARDVVDFRGRRALILDIGGGSVELMVADRERLLAGESLRLGVLRLVERFSCADVLSREQRLAMEGYIQGQLEPILPVLQAHPFSMVVGTSGTLTTLIQLTVAQERGAVPSSCNGVRIEREGLERMVRKLAGMTRAERAKLPGLDPKRADSVVAGGVLALTLMKSLKADHLTGCDKALREGLLLDYIETHRPGIRLFDAIPEVRSRSVAELALRFNAATPHAGLLAQLSTRVYTQLVSLLKLESHPRFGLKPEHLEVLQAAASLLDVGYAIDAEDHHKHGYYLIKNGRLNGWTAQEVELVALLVRYHRKALPRRSHEGFGTLDKQDQARVRLLGGILRVIAGLDRSRASLVTDVTCVLGKHRLELHATAQEPIALELWTANRRTDLLEEAVGLPVLVCGPLSATRTVKTIPVDPDVGQTPADRSTP